MEYKRLQKEEKKIWNSSNVVLVIVCMILAFIFLLFCSRSSFLFSYNNWDDANSYFSMGKFMMNGGVIYRDLYDQKGPFLYLLYGAAYLLSHNTFMGVFVFEVLAITGFLFYGYKILRLYTTAKIAYLVLPVLPAVTLSSLSFYWGGAAEEFCLPLFMASFYSVLKYFKQEYPNPPKINMIVWNGILAGIILQLKYTLLGFYFAWMAVIAVWNLTKINWKKSLQSCIVFLLSMGITMIPWLLYFGKHQALDDWFQCYVYNNIFLYSDLQKAEGGMFDKFYQLAKILYNLIWDNFSYFSLILIGFYCLIFSKAYRWYEKINTIFLFIFLFLGIYIGGANIFYYSIPLMIFSVLGLGEIGKGIHKIRKKLGEGAIDKKAFCFLFVLIALGGLFFSNRNSMNTEYRKIEKEEHFLWEFQQIVEKEENPTLLNINMLDAGLYTVADIVPTCKYFQTNGINLEEMRQEQEKYIKEGRTMFVISRFDYPDYILEKYELIKEVFFKTDGKNENSYYLFRLKKER